jgi:hypothetical protein
MMQCCQNVLLYEARLDGEDLRVRIAAVESVRSAVRSQEGRKERSISKTRHRVAACGVGAGLVAVCA